MMENIFSSYLSWGGVVLLIAVCSFGVYSVYRACQENIDNKLNAKYDEGFADGLNMIRKDY
jgi:hypothetical protein